MKTIVSKTFQKDIERCKLRGYDLNLLKGVVSCLQEKKSLDKKHRNHRLKGNWNGCWECHIEPNWLLIYRIENDILYLVVTGTHADLF